MKKTLWGYRKTNAMIFICFSDFKKNKKFRKRAYLRAKMRERRPKEGYKKYSVRRSKPYHTYDSEEILEENKYFWKEFCEEFL